MAEGPPATHLAPGGPSRVASAVGLAASSMGPMNTTPLWVPLVVAGLGFAATLLAGVGGAALAQRWASQREDRAWDREQQRERERQEREDRQRTFDHRRQALEDFFDALRAMGLRAYEHGMGLSDDLGPELPEGWQTDAFQCLHRVELYASPETARLASTAYSAAWRWGYYSRYGRDDDAFYDRQEALDEARAAFLEAMRRDLSVPD